MAVISTITTGSDARGLFPDSSFLKPDEVIPDSLALNELFATQTGEITGDTPKMRVPFVSADATAAIVKEGDDITPATPTLDEVAFNTVKFAILTKMSNEAFASNAATNLISVSAQRAVTGAIDNLMLNNTATEGQPTGLLNTTGISTVTEQISDNLDPLLDLLGTIGDEGGQPTALTMSFGTWAKLLKLKDSTKRGLVADRVADAPTPSLFGVPVVLNQRTPADTILAVDSSVVFAAASQIEVARDSSYYFGSDSTALRITARVGFGVSFPERIGKVTLKTTA